MNGADPIAWRDIAEWSRLTGNEPSPEELRMLLDMDAAFREAIASERKKEKEKFTHAHPSRRFRANALACPFQRLLLSGAKANWRARSIVARIRQASDHSPKTDLCDFGSAWHSASRNFIQAL